MNPDRAREEYLKKIKTLSSTFKRRIIVRDDVTESNDEEIIFGNQNAAHTTIIVRIVPDGIAVTFANPATPEQDLPATPEQNLTHFFDIPTDEIATSIKEILRYVVNAITLNVSPNRRIFIHRNEMTLQITNTFLPNYTRVFPADDADWFEIIETMAQHIFNRFFYTWIIFRYIRQLEKLLKMTILIDGGSQAQDQSSGQGQDYPASHVARLRINPEFALRYPLLSSFILLLLSITENMPKSVNQYDGFGGEIDRLSESLINDPNIDFSVYTERFIQIIMARLDKENNVFMSDAIETAVEMIRNLTVNFEQADSAVDEMILKLHSLGADISSRFAR